jgi:hypothetical protein
VRRFPQTGVKFLDQARFTKSWLASDQDQLPIAPPRPPPAADEHGNLLLATH